MELQGEGFGLPETPIRGRQIGATPSTTRRWAVGPSLSTRSLMTGDRSVPFLSKFSRKRLLTPDHSKPAPPLALSRLSTDPRYICFKGSLIPKGNFCAAGLQQDSGAGQKDIPVVGIGRDELGSDFGVLKLQQNVF